MKKGGGGRDDSVYKNRKCGNRNRQKLNFTETDESADGCRKPRAARCKISARQIVRPSRRDNIVNRKLNYFGGPKAWLLFSAAVFAERRRRKEIMKRARIIRGSIIRARTFQCASDPRLIHRNLRLGGWRSPSLLPSRKFPDRKSMIIPRLTCVFVCGVNLQRFYKSDHFVVHMRRRWNV